VAEVAEPGAGYNCSVGYEREIEIARAAAVRAGELALRHQARGVAAETKDDLSPVTIADRECERLIASMLAETFPEDGLLGEEGGQNQSRSGRRWIIDPIDGTRDFLRGLPGWAVLIALENGRDVDAGVCHFPAQNVTYYAARGAGAWRNDSRIRSSQITELEQALVCISELNFFSDYAFGPRLVEWMKQLWAVRNLGSSHDAMMVAAGQAEAWLEPTGKPWDFASLKIIGEEAGAVFFNFDGGSSIYGGNGVLAVPALADDLRALLLR
jgi:histidinol-phosphatase